MPSIYNTVLVQNECNAGNDTIYKAFVNIGKIVRIDSYRILLEIFFVYSECVQKGGISSGNCASG